MSSTKRYDGKINDFLQLTWLQLHFGVVDEIDDEAAG